MASGAPPSRGFRVFSYFRVWGGFPGQHVWLAGCFRVQHLGFGATFVGYGVWRAHAEGVVGVAIERGALVDVVLQGERQHQAQMVARAERVLGFIGRVVMLG